MDYNNDGKLDIISGDSAGNVWIYINLGTTDKPKLAAGKKVHADGKPISASRKTYKKDGGRYVVDKIIPGSSKLAEVYTKIHLADWDGDGLKDLLIGHSSTIIFYKNAGTKSKPVFKAPVTIDPPKGGFASRPSPHVVDFDGDGKKDLLVSTEPRKLEFYRNVGTAKAPKLGKAVEIVLKGDGFEKGSRNRIEVVDWNNDGKMDILVGNFYSDRQTRKMGGNVWLFLGK
ncbi:MAG: VCBS repeat-containing protein [Phycisphaerales bacterium]|nr:VCBS repeat-containing protein [Phycisphaerales bacterium]